VRQYLSNDRVRSVAVDLDPRDFDGTTAPECSSDIAQVLEDHERVILVGTSCSGIIIPVVTMLRRIDHLVFVCEPCRWGTVLKTAGRISLPTS
jgi:hypothetical protein